MKVLLSSVENRIEIFIGNRFCEFSFHCYARGFHVYKDVWSPLIGEEHLDCKHKEGNEHYAVAVHSNGLINKIYLDICCFAFASCKFLHLSNTTVRFRVTWKRVNRGARYGLELTRSKNHRGQSVGWRKNSLYEEPTIWRNSIQNRYKVAFEMKQDLSVFTLFANKKEILSW